MRYFWRRGYFGIKLKLQDPRIPNLVQNGLRVEENGYFEQMYGLTDGYMDVTFQMRFYLQICIRESKFSSKSLKFRLQIS